MKLRTLGLLLAMPLVFAGCEDGDAAGEEGAAGGAGEAAEGAEGAGGGAGEEAGEGADAAEAAGPDAVCATLIAAIKAKNVEDVVANSLAGAAEAVTAESIEGMAAALGEATCGEAAVDGDKATVSVTAGEETREIPFGKDGDDWKFDSAGYAAKYPPPAAEPAKGKKKGKKKKGKKKKKKKK